MLHIWLTIRPGYIRVSRFAEDTADEVARAVAKLKAKGMKNLILDLEDNGGGYLGAAVELASQFLSKGDPVVFTKGLHSQPAYFNLDKDGDLRDMKVVVMVNQYSASASEILSGALQDNDRGLIVGRRTFGKGLVQRPFPFPDGSMIRLTTARYYTPSGRSIQKHYEKGQGEEYMLDLLNRYKSGELWSADSIKLDRSLRYETLRNHRPVYGGGGIMPDVFVRSTQLSLAPTTATLWLKAFSISSASIMSMPTVRNCPRHIPMKTLSIPVLRLPTILSVN